jgi:hypothetical protein
MPRKERSMSPKSKPKPKKAPSAAQLAAREKFKKMVRDKMKAKK